MKLAQYESVLATLGGKQSLLDNSPSLVNALNKLETETKNFRDLMSQHSTDITWVTAKRRQLNDEMMSLAFRINRLLITYAINTKNSDLVNQFDYSASDFMKGGFAAKRLRVEGLLKVLAGHLPELATYSVTQSDYDTLLTLFNEVENLSGSPRMARTNKVVLGKALDAAVRKIDALIKYELDALMLKLESIDPDAFAHYRAAKKLVHAPTKHRDPESSSSDQDDGVID